jgi:basic membrane protein A
MKKRRTIILVVLLILSLTVTITGCGSNNNKQEPAEKETEQEKEGGNEKLKVGFIYLSTPGDGGWAFAHDQGRKYLEDKLPNVETSYVENIPEGSGDADRIMEQMIKNGVKVIFATSFGYMDSVINMAKKYPEVYFLHCTGFKRAGNVSTYDIKEYNASYLTGVVAGKMTKNGKIGYVAAQPIPSVIRAIDSFALGVKAVNPDAKVQLVWTSTWYDPAKEKEAALGLLDTGVDVIAQYQDTPAVQQAAEERGAFAIGYHSDMRKFAPNANLTSYLWNWGPIYVEQVKAYQEGTWKGTDIWVGMEAGAADIAPLNEKLVPADVKELVEATKAKILSGEITVFKGLLKDNTGKVVSEAGQNISDEELRGINWLADNIVGAIPGTN